MYVDEKNTVITAETNLFHCRSLPPKKEKKNKYRAMSCSCNIIYVPTEGTIVHCQVVRS